MKHFFILIAFLISAASFSIGPIEIGGEAALKLYSTLKSVGAEVDCGAGTCGIEATEVRCLSHQSLYECLLKAPEKRLIGSKKAKTIFETIVSAGIETDCGAGTCGFELQSIVCFERDNTYQCIVSL